MTVSLWWLTKSFHALFNNLLPMDHGDRCHSGAVAQQLYCQTTQSLAA
jgi:hypothetical protein